MRKNKITSDELNELKKLMSDISLRVNDIAKRLGITRQSLYYILNKYKLRKRREIVSELNTVKCLNCGKEFIRKRYRKRFCNWECRKKYFNEELECCVCGKKFFRNKKNIKNQKRFYCSIQCFYNKGRL